MASSWRGNRALVVTADISHPVRCYRLLESSHSLPRQPDQLYCWNPTLLLKWRLNFLYHSAGIDLSQAGFESNIKTTYLSLWHFSDALKLLHLHYWWWWRYLSTFIQVPYLIALLEYYIFFGPSPTQNLKYCVFTPLHLLNFSSSCMLINCYWQWEEKNPQMYILIISWKTYPNNKISQTPFPPSAFCIIKFLKLPPTPEFSVS